MRTALPRIMVFLQICLQCIKSLCKWQIYRVVFLSIVGPILLSYILKPLQQCGKLTLLAEPGVHWPCVSPWNVFIMSRMECNWSVWTHGQTPALYIDVCLFFLFEHVACVCVDFKAVHWKSSIDRPMQSGWTDFALWTQKPTDISDTQLSSLFFARYNFDKSEFWVVFFIRLRLCFVYHISPSIPHIVWTSL